MAEISKPIRVPLDLIEQYESLEFPKELTISKASFPEFARRAIQNELVKLQKATAAKNQR